MKSFRQSGVRNQVHDAGWKFFIGHLIIGQLFIRHIVFIRDLIINSSRTNMLRELCCRYIIKLLVSFKSKSFPFMRNLFFSCFLLFCLFNLHLSELNDKIEDSLHRNVASIRQGFKASEVFTRNLSNLSNV